jgi:hypothetical protein
MVICENFENCMDIEIECPHKIPHLPLIAGFSPSFSCRPCRCERAEGKVECLKINLKKGESNAP